MIKVRWTLALAGAFTVSHVQAISLDQIQLWTGAGTNRAALVVEWNSPEIFNRTTVPAPVTAKTLVWGYRFNGSATGAQMLEAVLAADPRLYVVADQTWGTFVEGIGYNLNGNGVQGITDGALTNSFANRFLTSATVDPDAALAVNPGDLFWSGYFGPNWMVWTELGDAGGFENSPNRGSSDYWNGDTGIQGQWAYANFGVDDLVLTNGSWLGFSVAAAGYDGDTNDPAYSAYNNDEAAPLSPDGTYVAYVCNTNDFAVQVVSTNNLDPASPYNNPAAVLNRPALRFFDPYSGDVTNRTSIIDDPYNVAPDGSDVITEIASGGQITVKLGRKIYDDPNNPYGIDLIVYGNSFFDGISGASGFISDDTDLSVATLTSSAMYGHSTTVSVSQDGTNWFAFPTVSHLFPDNAYRWDNTNSSWTAEEMNPTKPLNPFVYTNSFARQTVAGVLDQFVGAAGGTGYSLKASGLPWIQYVRFQPGAGAYTVIDAVAGVNPAAVGDALSIGPDNLAAGCSRLAFQSPGNSAENQISIVFSALSGAVKISTVGLSEFSSYAPVIGNVSSAYQIQACALTGPAGATFLASVGLRAGDAYPGDGTDLRVFQWSGTQWTSEPFSFNPANREVCVSGVTNSSAFVISQIVPPRLGIQGMTNGFTFQYAPVSNCAHIMERSGDLITWTPILTNLPDGPQMVTLQDTNAPAGRSFYRLRLELP